MEDDQIIKLFQRRNPDAQAKAQDKYGPLCRRLAANMLGPADPEECVNDFLAGLETRRRVLFVRRVWYTDSLQSIAADLSRTRARLRRYLIERG